MKPLFFILGIAGVGLCRADDEVRLTVEATFLNQPGEVVMKMKGDLVRTDVVPGRHEIVNLKTRARFLVDDQKKQVTDLTLRAQESEKTVVHEWKGKFKSTGRIKVIEGFTTEEFESSFPEVLKVAVWVARDYPKNGAEVLRVLNKASTGNEIGRLCDLSSLPGPVLRTVVTGLERRRVRNDAAPQEPSSMSTVKSVKEVTLDDKEFEIPKGYQVRKLRVPPGLQEPGKGK